MTGGTDMSQLLIVGNINEFTFTNAIIGAYAKSRELWGEKERFEEIYVIHSRESFKTLFKGEGKWLEELKKYEIDETIFVNRVMDIEENFSVFIKNIKKILATTNLNKLIIDVSNGTAELRSILAIIAYILDIQNVYFINSSLLLKEVKNNEFCSDKDMRKYYKKMVASKEIDKIAYLNLVEVTRYVEKIDELSKVYEKFNEEISNSDFFKKNFLNAISFKFESDSQYQKDNTLYRISSSAISASLEDLIDRFLLSNNEEIDKKTLGNKIHILQNIIEKKASATFDVKFLQMFNEFMLYLRNSSTHKGLNLSDTEKMKASLSMQMSIIFLEYYSTIVLKELMVEEPKKTKRMYTIKDDYLDGKQEKYFGLDGDNTGYQLEILMQNTTKEEKLQDFSQKVKNAQKKVVDYIKKNNGKIIFAEGDDILFKGKFSIEDLNEMKQIYNMESRGCTCSIAYGSTFKEVFFAMKIAKCEKNTIKGVTIV